MTRTVFAVLIASATLLAQNAGVQGQVTDSSGAAIPNATLKLSNVETGVTLTYNTNEQGLPDGLTEDARTPGP